MSELDGNQYVLGRGMIYVDRFLPNTTTSETGERFFGNAPSFTITTSADTLDHFKSTGGLKIKDRSVDLQVNRSGSFTGDNISPRNLAYFFNGITADVIQTSATAVTETVKLYKGARRQLGVTTGNPSGVRKISNLTVTTTGGSPVTISQATNYIADLERGAITGLDEAATITDGTEYIVTYDVTAAKRTQILAKNNSIYCAIRFIADNPEGEDKDFFLPYVKLSANGDYSLIGDDWQTLGFNMEVLEKDSNTSALYIDGQAVATP